MNIPLRALERWRRWWCQQLPRTPLWQACRTRFMPPVDPVLFPSGLLERFAGNAAESLFRLLRFLSPITVRQVAYREGC